MVDVFISHIHEEAKLAEAIKRFLNATIELPVNPVTLTPRQPHIFVSSELGAIRPGEDWLARLKQELVSAKVMIPLLTEHSLNRYWVNFETGAAWLADKKIFPAWCGEQPPNGFLPKQYADWQFVQLPNGAGDLLKAVEDALGAYPNRPPKLPSPGSSRNLHEALKRFYSQQ